MMPILTDNARMLASAFRNLSAAQKESRTEVVQQGVAATLSTWKDGRIYRNSLVLSYRDDLHHDKYSIELRDLIAMAVVDDMLIVQTEDTELVLDVTDELVPAPWPGSAPVCPDSMPPRPPRRRERRRESEEPQEPCGPCRIPCDPRRPFGSRPEPCRPPASQCRPEPRHPDGPPHRPPEQRCPDEPPEPFDPRRPPWAQERPPEPWRPDRPPEPFDPCRPPDAHRPHDRPPEPPWPPKHPRPKEELGWRPPRPY